MKQAINTMACIHPISRCIIHLMFRCCMSGCVIYRISRHITHCVSQRYQQNQAHYSCSHLLDVLLQLILLFICLSIILNLSTNYEVLEVLTVGDSDDKVGWWWLVEESESVQTCQCVWCYCMSPPTQCFNFLCNDTKHTGRFAHFLTLPLTITILLHHRQPTVSTSNTS